MKNHLDQCVEVQYLLNITSLGPALFSNDSNIGNGDYRNSLINLVNILLFKEGLKINERNPTLNAGLKGIAIVLRCFKTPFPNFM